MSYYYCYTIGIKDKENKIRPFGPYDSNGKLKNVIEKSRSFASDLHEYFYHVQENQITEELRKEFSYNDGTEMDNIKYLPIDELPKGSYLIKGYFLIEDIEQYEQKNLTADEIIVNMITPTIYAEKLKRELIFGKNTPKKDDEENEYIEPNASDYMFYVVEDYNTKEYEADLLHTVALILDNYDLSDDEKLVILETEG